MSEERIIHQADLSRIEWNIKSLSEAVGAVHGQVASVSTHVVTIEDRVDRLAHEFAEFVRQDLKAKELQLAETRIIKVRQDLEQKFGHYDEVRRKTTGILQATDVGIVRQETITTAAEDLMLSVPRYWLAPCLVSLAAWLSDDRALADKAAAEGLQRDINKAALFYALVSRRLGRLSASSAWLDHFFSLQDPTGLNRETVILIDGLASGVFGGEARGSCSKVFSQWIEMLSERVGFVEEQRSQWKRALLSKAVPPAEAAYPYLRKHSPTWPVLDNSMATARMYRAISDYFRSIFTGEIAPSSTIVVAVDVVLDTLVSRFDDEELPLRRDERVLTLIIEEGGDKEIAYKRASLETEALAEKVSFTQLLTNSAMHPETSHATRATQRYAIALSRDWILDAHNDIVADNRKGVPADVDLNIDNWQGSTTTGGNEEALLQSLRSDFDQRIARAVESVKLTGLEYLACAVGVALILLALLGFVQRSSNSLVYLVLGLAASGWFYYQKNTLESRQANVRADLEQRKSQAEQILKAALAEVVDWRRDYTVEDRMAATVTETLQAITPEQHLLSSHDSARPVVIA
jgi:hypothetical protein